MESALTDLRMEDEEETRETVAWEMAQESEVHDKQSYLLLNFMRVRVEINVCKSLKWRKKLLFAKMKECYATFKYEKLTTFCFLYGRLGHGESYCPIRMVEGSKDLLLAWDISLKAPPRRTVGDDSIWLLKPGEIGQKLWNFLK
ncbi:hypothetical protein Goklo_007469 [Gossypium klotzschianum]|uniref:Zinc knuckle CX2CX4HX4C domain-containing protein n=1 Tax=Gossypium klotzschianum TaxID=34286 RepID=A0A7J8W2H5_9ROSI|nr:hypothetical protein [Gossypium klotzschianum]